MCYHSALMMAVDRIEELREEALSAVVSAGSTSDLESVRVRYLGRSAELTEIKKGIRDLSPEERREVGGAANKVTGEIESALSERIENLAAAEREERLSSEAVDVTLPGVPYSKGSLHPSLRVIDEVVDFFVGLGYKVAEGPEVETDYYNFTALNIPPGHPARGMQDTFFIDEGLVLRTHTSPVQIRTMLSQEPPVYVVCPGRTYRRDSDPTHTPIAREVLSLPFLEEAEASGFATTAAVPHGGVRPSSLLAGKPVIVVGAEGAGLPEEVISACQQRVTIPALTASLNAAVAASILLYEAYKRVLT